MKIWRCPSGTSLLLIVVGVYWIINCSWTSLPLIDLNVLIHWLSFFEPYCPQLIDSSFDHLYPPTDLNTVCFHSRRSIVLPPGVSRRIDVISVRNLQTPSMFFLFKNLSYFGIKSHISKVMSIQVWLLKWNQRDVNFWKYFWKSNFVGQRSNTRYSM